MKLWCDKCDGSGRTSDNMVANYCHDCSGKGYTHVFTNIEELKVKAMCLDVIYKLIDNKLGRLEFTDEGAIEIKPYLKLVKEFEKQVTDYKCDDCQKTESEVGSLIHGRLTNGQDYQFCKNCRPKYGETLTKLSL